MNTPSAGIAPLMRPRIDLPQVYLCRRPVDFRKGMRALAVLVEQELGLDPFAETVYVFTNRRRTAVKCLAWERNGFCLWHKHLEAERFKWPLERAEAVVRLTGQELHWLLDGLDLRHLRTHKALSTSIFYSLINSLSYLYGGVSGTLSPCQPVLLPPPICPMMWPFSSGCCWARPKNTSASWPA